jgi:hypothetical protein
LFVTGCKNILCKSSVYSNFINLLESENNWFWKNRRINILL